MASKYYCDGCDKELQTGFLERISVTVKKNGDLSAAGGAYELCKSCAAHLVRNSNPVNWDRCAPDRHQ